MKAVKFVIIILITLMVSSCHHTSEPIYIPLKYTQLNTVIAPWQKDNDLLPWKGQYHTMIINSVDDVYATQTERFIEENPNWLNVDFSTKSIITVRTILFACDYWQYTGVKEFSVYNADDDSYMNKGDYYLNVVEHYLDYDGEIVDEDENQYRISQIAIVTDKVPSEAQMKQGWSVSFTKN